MKSKQYRGLLFIYGLIAGLALGLVAGFMLRTFWNVPSPEFTIVSKRQESSLGKDQRRGRNSKTEENYERSNPGDTISSDSLDYGEEFASADTISSSYNGLNGDEIIVATEELIFSRVIPVSSDTTSQLRQGKNLDSLLIDDNNNYPLPAKYKVEFWKSPINYKGYRLQKDRLVVYGIEDYEEAVLRRIDGKLFLWVGQKSYVLEENPEYRPLIASKNPQHHN